VPQKYADSAGYTNLKTHLFFTEYFTIYNLKFTLFFWRVPAINAYFQYLSVGRGRAVRCKSSLVVPPRCGLFTSFPHAILLKTTFGARYPISCYTTHYIASLSHCLIASLSHCLIASLAYCLIGILAHCLIDSLRKS
jgi:hypothetical protein